ncbi:oxidoreductase [Serinibacter arcticus]|uniref:Oxidoreductase n=1 Tax=Serinibacter arcticus TaxID=1655435 RepID=A0A2U1ZUY3_9MICO|nr:NAD-dependent epimerase/dehydratase family protein [Serinibacter arcticus]PWD50771.1 oxidoreductase [Serinibacter arcticus]
MRLLVLGGSVFLGRAVVAAALREGHEVVCLTRGESGEVPDGAAWVRGDRTHPDGLAEVREAAWDAVVDVSLSPGQVRRSVAELSGVGHYVLVSSGSVYADTASPGLAEDGPLLPPLDGDDMADTSEYGPAKVACEEAVAAAFPGRATIVRAGLIGGDGDVSGRSGWWPWRMAHPADEGGRVLVPVEPDLPVQLIDVEDLAAWIVHCARERVAGAYNAVGDPVPLATVLEAAQEAAGVQRELVGVDGAWLLAHGVAPWSGPGSVPLWLDDPEWFGFTARSNAAAREEGLTLRPLVETLRAALEFHEGSGGVPRSGLSDARERELLALAATP